MPNDVRNIQCVYLSSQDIIIFLSIIFIKAIFVWPTIYYPQGRGRGYVSCLPWNHQFLRNYVLSRYTGSMRNP